MANQYPLNPGSQAGKMNPRSDSPFRLSGWPVNLIAISSFNLDIETIKYNFLILLNFTSNVISVYFSSPFHTCLDPI